MNEGNRPSCIPMTSIPVTQLQRRVGDLDVALRGRAGDVLDREAFLGAMHTWAQIT